MQLHTGFRNESWKTKGKFKISNIDCSQAGGVHNDCGRYSFVILNC